MPIYEENTQNALELLEEYHKLLVQPQDKELSIIIERLITIFKSRLFHALVDIQKFYENTLVDGRKSTSEKVIATQQVVERWEKNHFFLPCIYEDECSNTTINGPTELNGGQLLEPHVAGSVTPTPMDMNGGKDTDMFEVEEIILDRSDGGLGFSIAGGADSAQIDGDSNIYVTKLIVSGAAYKDGRLHLNDILLVVNDKDLTAMTHAGAVSSLKNAENPVTLVVKRLKAMNEVVRDILLRKENRGLGFSIAGGRGVEGGNRGIFVTKLIDSGAAFFDGQLTVGDRLIAVDGKVLENASHDEAVNILKASGNEVLLRIARPVRPDDTLHGSPAHMVLSGSNHLIAKGELECTSIPRKVTMQKGNKGLGFNIVGGEDGEGIFVSFILAGGVADLCGEIQKGDQILSVNSIDVRNSTHEEAAAILKAAEDEVELMVVYRPKEFQRFEAKVNNLREQMMAPNSGPGSLQTTQKRTFYARVLFDYDPTKDDGLPSRGLAFKHGDILHVLNASDEEWWQAKRVGNSLQRGIIGIVPSKQRMERKEKSRQRIVKFQGKDRERMKQRFGIFKRRKRPNVMPTFEDPSTDEVTAATSDGESVKSHEEIIPSYEVVHQVDLDYARPVIILGATKDKVNDQLMNEFADKFGSCVPHTTRQQREYEVEGRDYHFVKSREEMEDDIRNNIFIEAGQYNDNLYGTSVHSVRKVADDGKHCILDVSGNAIIRLVKAKLYPIAILIKPKSIEVLMELNKRLTTDEQATKYYNKTLKLETQFKELFTSIVIGENFEDIYRQVKDVINENSGSTVWVAVAETI